MPAEAPYMMNTGFLNRKEVSDIMQYTVTIVTVTVAFTKWLNYMLAPVDCYGNSIPTNQKNYEASTKYGMYCVECLSSINLYFNVQLIILDNFSLGMKP